MNAKERSMMERLISELECLNSAYRELIDDEFPEPELEMQNCDATDELLEDANALLAEAAPQPEQSGLVEALSEAVEALQEAGDFRAAGKGEKALTSYRAALSSQGQSNGDS